LLAIILHFDSAVMLPMRFDTMLLFYVRAYFQVRLMAAFYDALLRRCATRCRHDVTLR